MHSIQYCTESVAQRIMGNLFHNLYKTNSEVFQQFKLHVEEFQPVLWGREVLVTVCHKIKIQIHFKTRVISNEHKKRGERRMHLIIMDNFLDWIHMSVFFNGLLYHFIALYGKLRTILSRLNMVFIKRNTIFLINI